MPTESKLYTMDMLNRIAQGEFDDDLRTANMREAGIDEYDARKYAVVPKRLAMDYNHPNSYYKSPGVKENLLAHGSVPSLSVPADVVAGINTASQRADEGTTKYEGPGRQQYAKYLNEGYPGAPGEDYVRAIQDRIDLIDFALPEGYEGSERYMREPSLSQRMGEPITEEVRLIEVKRDLESKLDNFKESRHRYFQESLPYSSVPFYTSPEFVTTLASMAPYTKGEDFGDMERALYRRYELVNRDAEPYGTDEPIEDLIKLYGY